MITHAANHFSSRPQAFPRRIPAWEAGSVALPAASGGFASALATLMIIFGLHALGSLTPTSMSLLAATVCGAGSVGCVGLLLWCLDELRRA